MKMPENPSRISAMARQYLLVSLVLGVFFLWSYWTTWAELISIWVTQPDYSHGFLVVPLALGFLWLRRDLRPLDTHPAMTAGLMIMFLSVVVRIVGLRYSFDSLDGYSLVIWIGAAVVMIGGWPTFRWALPSLLFLLFMVPLPFRLEQLLSVPLQRVATEFSCFLLQCLGQPAYAEGTTINLAGHELFVEQACSGLRMFVGAFALAFAFLVATRRELWEQVLLLFSVVPISLLANSIRIVVTGLMYQTFDEQTVQRFSHDMAGVFMIPLAAAMFAMVLFYLSCLVRTVELVRMEDVMGRGRS
jgi:exosortase